MEKLKLSQLKSSKIEKDGKIVKNSLLQDIGNIELEIQKMTYEYRTPVNKTQIIDSNNSLFNQKAIASSTNKTDVSKSDHKILLMNRNSISNDNISKYTKANLLSEVSYLKLAESMRNYSNQKKSVEVKITDKPKTKPYNILSTKYQSNINIKKKQNSDTQNSIKTQNPQVNKLSQQICSERYKTIQIKSILKQTSLHTQDFNFLQTNLAADVSKQQDNDQHQIQDNFKDDNKLDKALKIYNSLKLLVHKGSSLQSQMKEQKEHKNQMAQ
ncbi:unnamed protein product (macronuclear) [Paramecium tetraurelia]|uniref:Uncharacterized protein n=1 Tax=Paramecium tetraurelia TaxID=5888 RepID=A0EEW4_PARTE|nr:uncharacterized protein GSPATT00026178001 [Paramecium tetraurelia]CAK93855.1 unnamed protein product [Paramecium tetraurelia]|eukprot:XP_001461228.1 hypothetical protein (macronuclear) [Paramecium tetraurelia strain d4-2]